MSNIDHKHKDFQHDLKDFQQKDLELEYLNLYYQSPEDVIPFFLDNAALFMKDVQSNLYLLMEIEKSMSKHLYSHDTAKEAALIALKNLNGTGTLNLSKSFPFIHNLIFHP